MVLKGIIRWTTRCIGLLILLLPIPIGVLQRFPSLRHNWFAILCDASVKNAEPQFLPIRCELLKDIKGHILELGPGPGANMECLAKNAEILSYSGLEPNSHMHPLLKNKTNALGLTFPIELYTLAGESLPFEDERFDTVIITYVLCSVNNRTQVLGEAGRVLKPGGKIFYMEHIASPQNTWMRWTQHTIEPVWKIFTDGCQFVDSWKDLDALRETFDVDYRFFQAPMPLSILKPHLIGVAEKGKSAQATEAPA